MNSIIHWLSWLNVIGQILFLLGVLCLYLVIKGLFWKDWPLVRFASVIMAGIIVVLAIFSFQRDVQYSDIQTTTCQLWQEGTRDNLHRLLSSNEGMSISIRNNLRDDYNRNYQRFMEAIRYLDNISWAIQYSCKFRVTIPLMVPPEFKEHYFESW